MTINVSPPPIALLVAAFCIAGMVSACAAKAPANLGISDADITSGVNERLSAEPTLNGYTIGVATDDGVVHLSGKVSTTVERDSAESVATASRGVVSVDNYIRFGGSPTTTTQ